MATSKRLTQPGLQTVRLSLWEGHPASPQAAPGSSAEPETTAGSGLKLCASFENAGPLGRVSKTLLASETWASPEFSLSWRLKATKCGCSVFQLAPSVRRTNECATGSSDTEAEQRPWGTPTCSSGGRMKPFNQGGEPTGYQLQTASWPTPTSRDDKCQSQNPERHDYIPNILKAIKRDGSMSYGAPTATRTETAQSAEPTMPTAHAQGQPKTDTSIASRTEGCKPRPWPTPIATIRQCSDATMAKRLAFRQRHGQTTVPEYLTDAVRAIWPTPRAEDSESTGAHRGVPDTLTSAARTMPWATPKASISGPDHAIADRPASGSESLPTQVSMAPWATPRAGKTTTEDPATWAARQAQGSVATPPLGMMVSGMEPDTSDAPILEGARSFAERLAVLSCWLMGFPPALLLRWPRRARRTARSSPRSETP